MESDLVSHLRFLSFRYQELSGPPCSFPAGMPGAGEVLLLVPALGTYRQAP